MLKSVPDIIDDLKSRRFARESLSQRARISGESEIIHRMTRNYARQKSVSSRRRVCLEIAERRIDYLGEVLL
jgi:hypothetical protein